MSTNASAQAARPTILAVDDDPDNLSILGRLLHPHYNVLAAPSGARALQIAAGSPRPDLILLDVMMPGMDGYDALARLRGNPLTRDIPVIFVTGLDSAEDEKKGLELGAVDYIAKPYRPPIILARVHTQLELKRARDWLHDQNVYLEAEVARRVAENLAIQDAANREQARLSHQNELILTSVGEGIYGADTAGIIYFINPAAASLLGYARDELLGKSSHATLHHSKPDGSPYPREDCPIHIALVSGVAIRGVEETLWRKDGSPLPVLFSSVPVMEGGAVVGAVATFRDITERKRYQAQLERQANFDDLTGLPNRNLLADRLSQALTRCRQNEENLMLLTLNLDRFREVVDNLGHGAGDQLLRDVATRLGDIGKTIDTLAHMGGDEFVLLAKGGAAEEAAALAQRVLQTLTQPFLLNEQELFLSASIGIALFPKDGEDSETLLKNAGAALYRAKALVGSDFSFYSAEMNAHSLEQLMLERDLRHAIERDELRLYYQPQMNLRNGEMIGMEALVRWQHPLHGLVSPLDFIPLAEDTGLIAPIGEWVLRTACAQNRAWQAAGLPAITVAVNLSARQFEAQDMVALTAQVLQETGLDPSYLELELTESTAMGNAEAFIGVTESLKGLGLTLSIDDFGTGYSSLSYLKRFAIDHLKIDQSFVRDIVQSPNSAAIVETVIALSHGLGLSVIAEGVETEAQLNFLRMHGCDEMQGFYFSKPLPSAEFEQLLREGRKLVFPAIDDRSKLKILS
ncbi:MAG: diguanylate cyclase [Gammaproteobacteria bacterium 28-57-27]|nr:MAG: diguanylate cyclase [Gammaproteobacteria bacterium 28-57-27]